MKNECDFLIAHTTGNESADELAEMIEETDCEASPPKSPALKFF